MENVKNKKNKKVYIPVILIIVLILAGGIHWYVDFMKYIKTDEAHVEADNVAISSKMMGRISEEFIKEGDSVKQGQLLVVLDSLDLTAQKNQAIAAKQQTEAAIVQAEAKYQFDLTNNKILEILLTKAQEDFDRAKTQFKGDVIT